RLLPGPRGAADAGRQPGAGAVPGARRQPAPAGDGDRRRHAGPAVAAQAGALRRSVGGAAAARARRAHAGAAGGCVFLRREVARVPTTSASPARLSRAEPRSSQPRWMRTVDRRWLTKVSWKVGVAM